MPAVTFPGAKSVIGEVNRAVTAYIFQYLRGMLPDEFPTSSKVFFSPVISADSDFREYQKRYETGVRLPYAVVSRQPTIRGVNGGMGGPNHAYLRQLWTDSQNDTRSIMNGWRLIPVNLEYHVRVYSATYEDLELIVQQMLFGMSSRNLFEYKSSILSFENQAFHQKLGIWFEEMPVVGDLPDRSATTTGAGYIYVLNFVPLVSAQLGYRDSYPALERIVTDLFLKDQDVPEFTKTQVLS